MSSAKVPKRKRPATSRDVAKRAGVPQSTVSYFFNQVPGRPVSPAAQERIREAAQALGYEPNIHARALRMGHSDEIVFIPGSPLHTYATVELILGAHTRALELGYSLGIYLPEAYPPEAWETWLRSIYSRSPAGLIASPFSMSERDMHLGKQMGVTHFAFMSVAPDASKVPVLYQSMNQAGALAGQHLVARGHRRIAYVAPHPITPARQAMLAELVKGLRSALDPQIDVTELPVAENSVAAASAALAAWDPVDHPTGIYSFRDEYCGPLLQAIAQRGWRVPQDIAVVGTDDSPICGIVTPPLTSVHFDFRQQGRQLIDIVDCQVHRVKLPAEILVLPPPRLVVRESS